MPDKETVEIKGIELFQTGVWNGDKYNEQDIDEMVASFGNKGFEAPVKLGHNSEQEKDGQPAFGWISRVYRQGTKLLGDLAHVPKRLGEAIELKQYRHVSIEMLLNYKPDMPKVLRAVALLGGDMPAVKGLAPLDRAEIVFDDTGLDIRTYTIDLNEDIQKEQEIQKQINTEEKRMSEELKKELKDANAKIAEFTDKESKLKDEVKEFSDKAETANAKLNEVEVKAKTDKIKAFCENLTKEGKLAPAMESRIKAVLFSADSNEVIKFSVDSKEVESTVFDQLVAIFSESKELINLGEVSKTEEKTIEFDDSVDPEVELDRMTKEFMDDSEANGTVLTYSEAIDKVLKANPEIKTAIEDK